MKEIKNYKAGERERDEERKRKGEKRIYNDGRETHECRVGERKLAETKEASSILSTASKCMVEYRWK